MTSFASRFAGAATLALAALPIAAIATTVHAAPVTIQISDLDLNSTAGQAVFQQRAETAAAAFCKVEQHRAGLMRVADGACRAAVKVEAQEKLAVAQAAQRDSRGVYAVR